MKNNLKKIVCLVMSMCLLLGMVSVNAAAEESSSDKEVFEAMSFLQLLKVIPENYYDYNTEMDELVSRADYADAVAKIIGEYDYKGNLYYYDVPETHYAFGSIAKLTEMGVVNGVGDGLFKPENAINGMSAYKIILSLMGYNVIAEVDGGYPAGYVKIAKKLDIYDEELISGDLTRGGMMKLLYRAMKANIYDTTGYSSDGSVEYGISDTETLLSIYHNIYCREGIVTAADMITLSGQAPGEREQAGIDGIIYNSDVRLNGLLGEEVEYFLRKNNDSERGTVLYAHQTGRSEVINIKEENISGFDKTTYVLSYYKTETTSNVSKATLSRGITLIYNGRVVDKKIDEIFSMSGYTVKLIENNNEYDTAIVRKYDNYVVGTIDSFSKAIYDKKEPEKVLRLDEREYDYLCIRDASGNAINFSGIGVGNVVSAYVSKDGKYMEVSVSDRQHSGKLTGEKKNGKYKELNIGGEVYKLAENVKTEPYKTGDDVVAYLDHTGKIAYLAVSSGNFFAAYAADGALIEDGFDKEYKLKLFKQDGTLNFYDCAERVKVDGNSIKDAEVISKTFENNGNFKRQLALFEVNSNGEIISIDTANFNELKESKSNSLQKNLNVEPRTWRTGVGMLGIDGAVNAETVIFGIPDDVTADADEYEIMNMRNMLESFSYKVESYNTTERYGYEKYIVIYKTDALAKETTPLPIVVTDVGYSVNKEGDTVEFISGYRGNTEVSLLSDGDETFEGLKEGMIVRTFVNNKGEVYDKEIIFEPDNKVFDTTETGWNDIFAARKGFVCDIVDDVIKLGWTTGSQIDQILPRNGAPVIVCESDGGEIKVYTGGFSDASTYYNAKEKCSSIVAITQHNRANMFVIYNEL